MMGEKIAVEFCSGDEVGLLVVVGNERDALVGLHDDFLVVHAPNKQLTGRFRGPLTPLV